MFAQHPHQHRHRRRAAVALTAVLFVGTGSAAAATTGRIAHPSSATAQPAVGGPTTINPYAVKQPLVAVAPATVRQLNRVTVTLNYFPARARVTVGIYDSRNRLWMYRYITVDAKGRGTGTVSAPSARGTYTVRASVARPAANATSKLVVV